jgi:hypothetical protein
MQKFIDACTCGRSDKAAVSAIKAQLEAKDVAIERLEEEIRRKDTEKDNLIHMQKDLQSQIEEIRLLLDSHANEAAVEMSDDKAAELMQRRVRGIASRKRVDQIRKQKNGHSRQRVLTEEERAAQMMQAKVRGKSARRLVAVRKDQGALPGQQRPPPMPMGGGPSKFVPPSSPATGIDPSQEGSSFFDENESVDSDYDYDESAFQGLGEELLANYLTLAKVYGQDEPPADEASLEWETRYFVLHDNGCLCHYDQMEDGLPKGDRGLVELASISAVEKVLNVNTFVMKAGNKVYLCKVEPHDEVVMRTWIAAISQQLSPK